MTPPGFDNARLRRLAAIGHDKKDLAFHWGWNFYHEKQAMPTVHGMMSGVKKDLKVYISQGTANSAHRLLRLCVDAPAAE